MATVAGDMGMDTSKPSRGHFSIPTSLKSYNEDSMKFHANLHMGMDVRTITTPLQYPYSTYNELHANLHMNMNTSKLPQHHFNIPTSLIPYNEDTVNFHTNLHMDTNTSQSSQCLVGFVFFGGWGGVQCL